MTPSRIAEALALSKGGAVTAMIDRLQRGGYLRRTRDPADRRQVLIEIIWADPLHHLAAHYAPIGATVAAILARYPDHQLRRILDFLTQCNDAVDRLAQHHQATIEQITDNQPRRTARARPSHDAKGRRPISSR